MKDKINQDLKKAMLAHDEVATTALRGLKGAILEVEVAEGKRKAGLTDQEIEKVLQREIKKRKESLEIYLANNRGELAEKEQAEIDIYSGYLPRQMTDQEILAVIDEVIADNADEVTNMGKVIGSVKAIISSRADGGRIAKLVQEKLK